MNGEHDDHATSRSTSRDHNGVNPLAQLFDLATDLVLPFRPYPTMEWPLNDSQAPFWAQINTVATVLADVAQNFGAATREGKSGQRKDCYVMEYVYETVFQRFFAWAVSKAWQPKDDERSFWYRNGWANARAVLAMPLVIDLFHKMTAVIRQGNFGYRPSPTANWVYPHLADYSSSLYFPWILAKSDGLAEPQFDATQGDPAETALERCYYRSRRVTFDLWKLLRKGSSLRELVDRQKDNGQIIPMHELRDKFWQNSPYDHSCPFTIRAVASKEAGLNTVWGRPWKDDPVPSDEGLQSELIQEVFQNDLQRAVDFYAFIGAVPDAVTPLIKKILDLKLKSPVFGNTIEDGCRFMTHQRFGDFIRWRFLEERLRFVVDRQLWERRVFDPPLPRAWKDHRSADREEENPVFLPDFERRGIRSILTPEIQFAICIDEILDPLDGREPQTCFPKHCSLLESAKTNPPQNSMKECRDWLSTALDIFLEKPSGFEAKLEETRQFPSHNLLLMSNLEKLRQGPTGSSKHAEWIAKHDLKSLGVPDRNFFALGLLLAAVVPLPDTLTNKEKEGLLGHTKDYIRREIPGVWKPWAELIEVQELLQAPPLMMPSTHWAWLKEALPKAYGTKLLSDLANVTLEDVNLSDKWEPSFNDLRCEKYFAYRGLLGMNPTIFQSLAELGHGYNAFGLRLIAEEADAATSERLSDDYQDFAEFLGSYIVWKPQSENRLNGVGLRWEPRLDLWRKLRKESETPNRSEPFQDTELFQWMNDLERQKIMIRMLGRVVVERQQRLARRAIESQTGTYHQALAWSHEIGNFIKFMNRDYALKHEALYDLALGFIEVTMLCGTKSSTLPRLITQWRTATMRRVLNDAIDIAAQLAVLRAHRADPQAVKEKDKFKQECEKYYSRFMPPVVSDDLRNSLFPENLVVGKDALLLDPKITAFALFLLAAAYNAARHCDKDGGVKVSLDRGHIEVRNRLPSSEGFSIQSSGTSATLSLAVQAIWGVKWREAGGFFFDADFDERGDSWWVARCLLPFGFWSGGNDDA